MKYTLLTFKERLKQLFSSTWTDMELDMNYRILREDIFWLQPKKETDELTKVEYEKLNQIIMQLQAQIPIQYIVGVAYFYDQYFNINDAVLIPRPETEELVDLIINDHKSRENSIKILDVGTGSGCIPIILKKYIKVAKITGWDVSPEALRIAKTNALESNLEIKFDLIDMLKEPMDEPWDIIVSNPPYIPLKEQDLMSVSTVEYEPDLALYVPDEDPLVFYRIIGMYAYKNLTVDGMLYYECNEYNSLEVKELLISIGFVRVELMLDMQGKNRMLRARR